MMQLQWLRTWTELTATDKKLEMLAVAGGKIKTLDFLGEFSQLKKLYLHSFKVDSLDALAVLRNLQFLCLENVGNGCGLNPLADLAQLEELVLTTPPGWDGSGKKIQYRTLAPLLQLKRLKRLTISDIKLEEDGLRPLYQMESLAELKTKNTFTTLEFAQFSRHRPDVTCIYAHPYHQWIGAEYYRCKKCTDYLAEFSGSDLKRRLFCLNCDRVKCGELVERFHKLRAN